MNNRQLATQAHRARVHCSDCLRPMRFAPIVDRAPAQPGVRRKDAVVHNGVVVRPWRQRGELGEEVEGFEHERPATRTLRALLEHSFCIVSCSPT